MVDIPKQNMSDRTRKLVKLLYEADLMELTLLDCPQDEYIPEARKLDISLPQNLSDITSDQIKKTIVSIFSKMFSIEKRTKLDRVENHQNMQSLIERIKKEL